MEVGDKFPAFSLPDENGEVLDSSSLEGIRYVIFFYPKDNTSGCTRENEDFSALQGKFMMRNVPVFGVSKDTVASHKKFSEKYQLKVKLLSDTERVLLKAADAWGTKMMYGKEVEGTIRTTYIVGKDGTVEAAWHKVKVPDHAEKVLEKVISLCNSK